MLCFLVSVTMMMVVVVVVVVVVMMMRPLSGVPTGSPLGPLGSVPPSVPRC